jgi:hypothetical protein
MGLVMVARPPESRGRLRATRACLAFAAALVVTSVIGAAPASANAGKVLVFTGTAGTLNSASATASTALQAAGVAGDYTVDSTADATKINAANLATYRAVVFVNSAGDVLSQPQEADLQAYVQNGGGFVGVGETAKLEEGSSFFDTLIGLTGASRTSASSTETPDVEFSDRVNPATRDLATVVKNRTDTYYQWTNNPLGSVHVVAKARFARLPDGSSVTNDANNACVSANTQPMNCAAGSRFADNANNASRLQPQSNRAVSWCRDIQSGRSFYTGMGQTADAYDATLNKHLASAVLWASGMVRGNCKATISSNYVATRLTPPNPTLPNNTPASPATANANPNVGEIDAVAMADDGRVFYAGRAVCFQGQQQITNWAAPNTGLGCGPIHVWDPRVAGDDTQNAAKVTKAADFPVFGAKGGGGETGATSKVEQGVLGIALDPDFTKGRPYVYVVYHPYWGGKGGFDTTPKIGPGFVRSDYMGERRLSRFRYDDAAKTLDVSSEIIIHRYMTQVFSCCHLGGSMDFDSKGNLYFATGDNTGNSPNSTNGGYTNAHPQHTIPCPGGDPAVFLPVATSGCGVDTSDPDGAGPLAPRTPCVAAGTGSLAACGYISYGDARQTSGNTNVFEGKLLRIKPLANPSDTPGIGTTYTIPGPDAPNGPNLFQPASTAVTSGKAKPEIFAMGVRNLYSIQVDAKTDKVAAAWVGPDQGTNSTTWGPAKTENAVMINSAGNYGWPFCTGNQQGYRAKLPQASGAGTTGGIAAAFGHPGTVGGGADGQTGGFWDCDDPQGILNDSPFNTGLERIPAARPVNIWYGPQGGCYDSPRNANGIPVYQGANNRPQVATPTQPETQFRRCPWVLGASQAPMTAGTYRATSTNPTAWPKYWDGRWFLADFAGGLNLRHALLMDPETEFTGGQPDAVDSLFGILPRTLFSDNRIIDFDFGADGSMYIGSYSGSNFTISNTNTGLWRISYTGGADTPGPDPQAVPAQNSSKVAFNIGKSGGISYAWSFPDGGTATGDNVSHTYLNGGTQQATLTVTYADGTTASKTINVEVPTTVPTTVTANVDKTLGLTLTAAATFPTFVPGVPTTYTAETTAKVISTMPDAALTIADPSTVSPGYMVNTGTPLPQALKARATNAANSNTAFATISGSPLSLLSYSAPITNDVVTVQFQQAIAANDALKAGQYAKTLTFTLSTTSP